jgi:hypothetical protein
VLLSTGPTDQPWLQIRAESAQRGPG